MHVTRASAAFPSVIVPPKSGILCQNTQKHIPNHNQMVLVPKSNHTLTIWLLKLSTYPLHGNVQMHVSMVCRSAATIPTFIVATGLGNNEITILLQWLPRDINYLHSHEMSLARTR